MHFITLLVERFIFVRNYTLAFAVTPLVRPYELNPECTSVHAGLWMEWARTHSFVSMCSFLLWLFLECKNSLYLYAGPLSFSFPSCFQIPILFVGSKCLLHLISSEFLLCRLHSVSQHLSLLELLKITVFSASEKRFPDFFLFAVVSVSYSVLLHSVFANVSFAFSMQSPPPVRVGSVVCSEARKHFECFSRVRICLL